MYRLALILVLLMCACRHDPKTRITKPMDHPNVYQAGGIFMVMQGVFIPTRFEDIMELWNKSGAPEEQIYKRIKDLQLQEAFEGPSFIFRDTTDLRNTFCFTEASYLDVEDGDEEKMFLEFEPVMMENCEKIGASCKLLANDNFSLSNGDRVYKMLYEVKYSPGEAPEYSTTYFIATKTRIVMAIVHNTSDDGEQTVRSMNIDRYFYVDPLPEN